ncbi:uncharacterized protein [Typha latifolia]|uniref:uncharacterized protein n=1 Tax=Typha latifolia TaxID=4733 RepID=UPI003C2D7C6B
MYRCFPSLFTFLLASSPVILCTGILLGVLLTYGEPNLPETDEENWKLHKFSYPKVGGAISDDLVDDKNGGHKIETYMGSKKEIKEEEARQAVQGPSNVLEGVRKGDRESEKEIIKDRDDKGMHNKKQSFTKMLKIGEEIGGAAEEDRKRSGHVDSLLGSSRNGINYHCCSSSDSVSGQWESSSPDYASEAEILPMLDELHPLLDSEHPQPAVASKDDSDDQESDDVSIEEEAEIQEDEDDEEAQEEKDDSKVVSWTADDQKNLMDVGTSEIERNQRLENLIARRRARKLLRYEVEKNLIDLDGNESFPSIQELSRFHVEIPQVFAPRKNPFDLPYGSDETIPGSAPSVLLPTRNPFDLPFDKIEEGGSLAGDDDLSHEEFFPVPQRDVLFRRHESFTVGTSFLGDLRQDWRNSRFKPYLFAEKMNMEETNFASLEGETSEKSDCKLSSSARESDTVSSVTDQECHQEVIENELRQENESPMDCDVEPPEVESSVEGELVHDDDKRVIDSTDRIGTHSKNHMFIQETDDAKDYQLDVKETNEELTSNSLISNGEEIEATEDKYESSSSSTKENEKDNEANDLEQPGDLEQTNDIVTNLTSNETEHIDESQVAEPVYDSSPKAMEKSLSNISALDETMYYADRSCFNSSYSLASLNPAEIPDVQSPKVHSSSGGGIWISPSLSCVEENESRLNNISVIRECDIIGDELSVIHEDFGHPVIPVLPYRPTKRTSRCSSVSSRETESTDGSSN